MHPRDLNHLVSAALGGGIEARHLSLELQHVSALENLPARDTEKGVRLALDRFGAGAAVSHLRKLMCDELKIDASFLPDVEKDATVQAMLLGMGDLARRLRMACVAAGVDTPQQLAFLKKHGWDQAQGRVFGETLNGLTFAAKWLTRSGKPQRVPLPGEA
jgi:EAL domain-containing protein (putative c-di-GMP-specific phosphodiesterase class I)